MTEAATGSRLLVALARESRWNEPGPEALVFYRPVLPFSADLARVENPTGEVSAAGWKLPGIAGPVTGAVDFALTMTPGSNLDAFEHLLGDVTKIELEAGTVYQYDFTQSPTGASTSFRAVYALPPADRAHVYGVQFGQLTQSIAPNAPIVSRLAGQAGHGTRLGTAEGDPGNLGTWTERPWLRGLPRDSMAGDVHVQITRDTAGGGVRFRVDVGIDPPTFAGPEYDLVYGANGGGRWQNLQDQDGADVGIWDLQGNRDPVEILFPGTATDHAALAVGDTWTFRRPLGWGDPVPTYLSGQRFTSAHLLVDVRKQGAAEWIPFPVDGGNVEITLARPVSVGVGNASKYPISMDRDQESSYTVQLPRRFRDLFFQDLFERHERFELRLRWLGSQIGAAKAWRESVTYEFPSVSISTAARPVGAPTAVIETLALAAEGSPDGDPPITITVTTARDWTPHA